MTIRSILVHLDDDARCASRLDIATGLAKRWGCHLEGLAASGRFALAAPSGPGLLGLDTLTDMLAQSRHRADGLAERFRDACADAGVHSFEALVDDDDAAPALLRHGRCSDLVIIGQDAPAGPALAEQVALRNARPTLVVPHAGRFDRIGENALVAWNDTPQAARALADALPLLQRARQVRVLQCDTPLSEDALARERLEALHRWLMRHGVDADIRLEATPIDVGHALLSHAAELGSDLLVAGAYGHARWTERMLGGVSRTLLASMTVPVLMSH